jgi:hypothetical protein
MQVFIKKETVRFRTVSKKVLSFCRLALAVFVFGSH